MAVDEYDDMEEPTNTKVDDSKIYPKIGDYLNEAYNEDNEGEDVCGKGCCEERGSAFVEVKAGNHSVNNDSVLRTTPPPPYSQVGIKKNDVNNDYNDASSGSEIESAIDVPAAEEDNGKWYAIDTFMLPAKMAYFFDQFKEASIWPYLILFQVSVGLSPSQAGLINGMRFLGCIMGAPIWGAIADSKNLHKQTAIVVVLGAMLFQVSQPFWGEGFGPEDLNKCPSNRTLKSAEAEAASGHQHNEKLFHILLIINVVACFFDGSTLTFADSGCQKRMRSTTRTIDFGRTRLFGSVGYGVGSIVASTALKYFPHTHITCYSGPFFIYSCASILLIVSFNFLYSGLKENQTDTNESNNNNNNTPDEGPKVRQILWESLKSFNIIFFLATVLFNGCLRALFFSFTYLYLKELDAPDMLLGISMVVSQIASVLFYYFSENLVTLCGGTMQVMFLSCFSWVIRLMCMSYMKNYWLIIPINALNGVSASLFVAASIIHVRRVCNPVILTTMHGIRNALFNGGGYMIAGVLGGQLYQKFGPKRLFLDSTFLCAGWALLMFLFLMYQKYRVEPRSMNTELKERKKDMAEVA